MNKITDYLPTGISDASMRAIIGEITHSFARAERELSMEFLAAIRDGKLGEWRASSRAERLVNVRAILDDLGSSVTPLIRPLVDAAVKEGGASGLADLAKIGKTLMIAPQAIYTEAVSVLASAAESQLRTRVDHLDRFIVRQADDVFARVGVDVAMRQLAGSLGSVGAAKQAIISDLQAASGPSSSPSHILTQSRSGVGRARIMQQVRAQQAIVTSSRPGTITAFVDKSGRRWTLQAYADMVSRTTAANAVEAATRARYIASDVTLTVVSEHPGACHICQPFEGKVISISGSPTAKDRARIAALGYDLVDASSLPRWSMDGPPFHPNCSHTVIPLDLTVSEALGGKAGMQSLFDSSAALNG